MRPGHLGWERLHCYNSVSDAGLSAGFGQEAVVILGIELGIVNTGLVCGNDAARQQGISVLLDHPEILLLPVRHH